MIATILGKKVPGKKNIQMRIYCESNKTLCNRLNKNQITLRECLLSIGNSMRKQFLD